MMFVNTTVEVSGIKRIVVDQTKVYDRLSNNDWIEKKSGKIIKDHIMIQRVKKMLKETVDITGDIPHTDYNKGRILVSRNACIGVIKKYRLWVNMETINIDRNIV